MNVDVLPPPGGGSLPRVVCTASLNGDPALARCADNRGAGNQGDGTQKKEDGNGRWWGIPDLWRKLFGGGH